MDYEVITDLNRSDIFNVAHKFTSLKGSEFNPLEIDFLFAFVTQIDEKDEAFKEYRIDKATLEEKMDRRLETKRISTLFKSLIGKYIEAEDEKKIRTYSIFDTLIYDKEEKVYTVQFSSKMKPFLLKLQPYTKGYLSDIFKLESTYSKKIYLLCAQWRKAGRFKIKVDKLMQELGVPEGSNLTDYGQFKRKILKTAEKNMLEKSSIYFEYQEKKKGKKVDEITFIIKTNRTHKDEEPKLFELELSDTQKELNKYVGSKIEGHIIQGFRVTNTDIFVETDVG
ncbi:MAG: RepB family plasmid replication initiator protein, partial [Alphaproteobacteria bacterium]|nr:RepB family plasmid replication initiator protein [Alphaproteobacteria bacterium]